jgi:hypothetical protein
LHSTKQVFLSFKWRLERASFSARGKVHGTSYLSRVSTLKNCAREDH